MNTVEVKDRWRRRAALGYIELGMPREAELELAELSPHGRMHDEAIILRLHMAQHWHDWKLATELSELLIGRQPHNVEWRIVLAYSIRRSHSLDAARRILEEALRDYPREAILHFNLGCYACVAGDIDKARKYVREAIRLNDKFARAAERDRDLLPIWAELPVLVHQAQTLALPAPSSVPALPEGDQVA